MKKILIAVILLHSTFIFSQKEANVWYFGRNAGLDFNSGSPVVLTDGQLNTNEGCASISDIEGNLLFYTDGITVYNRNHSIMQNGTGLKGDPSSTHSAIIVPKPEDQNIYYIFTVDAIYFNLGGTDGLQFSIVDMSLDGGLGAITTKNSLIHTPVGEKVTAIKKSNSNDYWIVSHKHGTNEYITYELNSLGLNTDPVISSIGEKDFSTGQIKISPDGSKLAAAFTGIGLEVFNFDIHTGKITNRIFFSYERGSPYGVEFSPNSNLLYVSNTYEVSQYNLKAGSEVDIVNSRIQLESSRGPYSSLQLGPDGKIYVAKSQWLIIDIIANPNNIGLGCNYLYNSLDLKGRRSGLGLPTFVSNFFNINSFDFQNVCFGDTTQFNLTDTVDSAIWDFGDIASGVNNTSTVLAPTHLFSGPGDYEVSVTVKVGTDTAITTSIVTIYEVPIATKPTNIKICDTNNDGFYVVNLTTQNKTILNGQDPLIFDVKYYAGLANYTNEISIAIPNSYTNLTAYTLETIYAKVYNINNGSCFDATDFSFQVFETPLPNTAISPLTECDNTSVGTDTDGIILFNLTQKETEILNGQSPSDFTISYFSDAGYATPIANPATFQNTATTQTIYIKMVNNYNNTCAATTNFTIEVFERPTTTSPVVLKQCDDDTVEKTVKLTTYFRSKLTTSFGAN